MSASIATTKTRKTHRHDTLPVPFAEDYWQVECGACDWNARGGVFKTREEAVSLGVLHTAGVLPLRGRRRLRLWERAWNAALLRTWYALDCPAHLPLHLRRIGG